MQTNHRPAFQSHDNNIMRKKVMTWKLSKNNKINKSLHSNLTYLETIKMDKTYMNRIFWLWYSRCHGVWSDWYSINDFRNRETQSIWLDTWLDTWLHPSIPVNLFYWIFLLHQAFEDIPTKHHNCHHHQKMKKSQEHPIRVLVASVQREKSHPHRIQPW